MSPLENNSELADDSELSDDRRESNALLNSLYPTLQQYALNAMCSHGQPSQEYCILCMRSDHYLHRHADELLASAAELEATHTDGETVMFHLNMIHRSDFSGLVKRIPPLEGYIEQELPPGTYQLFWFFEQEDVRVFKVEPLIDGIPIHVHRTRNT